MRKLQFEKLNNFFKATLSKSGGATVLTPGSVLLTIMVCHINAKLNKLYMPDLKKRKLHLWRKTYIHHDMKKYKKCQKTEVQ